jgi:ribosomal protein S18 acetylase RimI-like enzyme
MDVEQMRRGAEAPERVVPATVDLAAQDLADAFVTDPHLSWFFRDDARRDVMRRRFFEFLLRNMALPDGVVYRPAVGGAAAVWIPSETLTPSPLSQELKALPVLLGATGLARFGRLMALRKAMDAHHPVDRPHDYLWFLGVTPAAQGHGIGSRLIRSRLEVLDAQGRAAFLETGTDRNVSLYSRHGFKVIHKYRPTPDGPDVFAMWRDPL